jgi:hypothetical protein
VVLAVPVAGLVYYQSSAGSSCARCHEIQKSYDAWRGSTHRAVACAKCHGDLLSVDTSFHLGNLRRLLTHLRGRQREPLRLTHRDLFPVVDRCKRCHEQEFAQWQGGPHGITYAQVFLDGKHNRRRLLMDDCLRCHGMHFEGSIRDLVAPLSAAGPWKLAVPELANRPAIPCLACHQMHREGQPLKRRPATQSPIPGPAQELHRPSLALFDRRELTAVPVRLLALPQMKEGARVVKMSPDARQGLCYQCHAPLASAQAGSGDDRTPLGVHEGISCLACHLKHGQQTRASCAHCHPRLSNCGRDVEKMDTTFLSEKSPRNIHFVKCLDCHPKGVPPKRQQVRPAVAAP